METPKTRKKRERKTLNPERVQAAKPEDQRYELADASLPSFYLVVQPSGAKSFVLRYRRPSDSKHAKLTLGAWPAMTVAAAREAARKAIVRLGKGEDPVKRSAAPDGTQAPLKTFGDLAALFLSRHAERKCRTSTVKNYKGMLDNHVLPHWQNRPFENIRRADVRLLMQEIAEDKPVAANRTQTMLSGLFAWALDLDLIENNPCAGLKKATKEQSRDRVLTEREVSFLLTAIDRLPHPLDRDYVRFLLLSTQRRNEVARMKWDEISEVDLDGRQWLWTIPKGRTKQKREQLLPLSGDMITILEKRRSEGDGRPYVFGARSGKLAPYRDFDRLKIKLDRTITELNNGVQIPQWQLHDFRRTVVSIMGDDLDVDVYVAEKLLAHKGESFKGVADIYQRGKYLKKKKAALEAWADHLQCLRIKARGLEVVG